MKKYSDYKKRIPVFVLLLVCTCVCVISVSGAMKKEQHASAVDYNTEEGTSPTSEQKNTNVSVNITEQTQESTISRTDKAKLNEIPQSTADSKEEKKEQTKLKAAVSYVSSWNQNACNSFIDGALNKKVLNTDEERHLPIFKIDTRQDLELLMSEYGEDIFINGGYDEMPSFEETAEKYDEDFFRSNSLLLVYVSAPSGTLRFGVKEVDFKSNSICVYIKQTNNPQVFTDDMAAWIISIEAPDSTVNNCEKFDAVLDNG